MLQVYIEKNDVARAREALQGGCRWLVLQEGTPAATIEEIKAMAAPLEAMVTLENDAALAREYGLDGVWLATAAPQAMIAARKALAQEQILGVNVTTLDALLQVPERSVDYVTLAMPPAGLAEAVTAFRKVNTELPLVALVDRGDLDAVETAMQAGVNGVMMHAPATMGLVGQVVARLSVIVEEQLKELE